MKKFLMGFFVLASVAGVAMADGDAAAGKNKATACAACHGADGNSTAPTFPKLAGQGERYLIKQMKNIRCGALPVAEQKAKKCNPRSVPAMAGQLDHLSDQDFADIAAYFSSQTRTVDQAKKALVAKGEEIYKAGIRPMGIPACSACHSPTGQGNSLAGFPALGGQHAAYIETQLKAFRAAADGRPGRTNDGDTKIMRSVAQHMSDSQITAVASYISGLH